MKKNLGAFAGILFTVLSVSGLVAIYSVWLSPVFISAAAGILSFVLLMWVMVKIRQFAFKHSHPKNPHSQIIDALSEVARGNFNIILHEDDRGPHNEMAEAFNKMARELGDIEIMRQDFISNVSHEFQSPLTSIGGFAALLKDDTLPAAERSRYAGIIEMETRRLSSLSDNLLKLSSLDSEKKPLNRQNFRLDKQLQQAALTSEPQWSTKGINLEADLERCEYNGDIDLLSQVWVNLLHNAIKFTPEGGDIHMALAVSGHSAVVTISDNGIGIAPEDQLHIFERFYKADKSRDRALGGNGLGLSLVIKIVELHGGSVAVESEIGKGTRLTVTLPYENG